MKYINNDLAEQKILITGGAGFIGSNLAFYLQEHHPLAKVYVFDKFRNDQTFPSGNPTSLGHFKNLIGFKGEVITGDINNPKDIEDLEKFEFDIIFHQAAISDTTALNQELVMQTNHEAFLNLLELAKKSNAKMIYASSAGTYGNSPAPNIVGSGEIPENVYGFSKLRMDESIWHILKNEPQRHIVGLRYFNVYGEREFYKGKTASMILQLGLQAIKNKKVRLFKFGEQMRDFVYIQDVIQANIKAIESTQSGVYNVGSGKAKSFNDVIDCLKKELASRDLGDFEVEYFDNPYSFFQNHTEADITPTTHALGYTPRFDLQAGIARYIDHICAIAKCEQ